MKQFALTKETICGEYADSDSKVWNYVYHYQFIFKTFIIIWKILQPQHMWLAHSRLLGSTDNGSVHVQLNASVHEINNEQEQVNGI
jgi:hypothetical protein